MIAVICTNQILDGKIFHTLEQARNYVAMNYRRNWRKLEGFESQVKNLMKQRNAIDMMECINYGTRFYFVEVELQTHEG